MLKFKVTPQYSNSQRSDEYTLLIESEQKDKSFDLPYFSLPGSLLELGYCIQGLSEICHYRQEIDSLIESEQLQYFISQDLIKVDFVDNKLQFLGFSTDSFKLFPDIIERIGYKLEENPILPVLGKVWFAAENRNPYIGYFPHKRLILFSYRNSWNRKSDLLDWINKPIPVTEFVKDVSEFLKEFEQTELKSASDQLLKLLVELPAILEN